jgi:hypothetical protein
MALMMIASWLLILTLSYLLFRDLFHPSVRVITLVMFVCWPVVTLLNFGIQFSVDSILLTEDVFLRHEMDWLFSLQAT